MSKPRLQLIDGNKRIESLDFLRGLAACAVMLFHYTAASSITLSDKNPLRIIGVYGHLGVDVFFILSGFVIPYAMERSSYKIKHLGRFLLKRTTRLEIPFLILIAGEVLLIYVSSLTPWKTGVSERLDGPNILLHIGYLNGILDKPWLIPIFWTLAIEFQYYLLIAVIFPLLIKRRFISRISVVIGLIVLGFILPSPDLFFRYSLFFLIGILVFQVTVGVIKRSEFLALLTGVLILMYFQHGLISFFMAVITILIIMMFKSDWKWSNFLGVISYSIYLVHTPFGGRLLMLTNMYVQSETIKSILILGYLASTILVAWLFFLLIERPALFLSKKITYKEKSLRP